MRKAAKRPERASPAKCDIAKSLDNCSPKALVEEYVRRDGRMEACKSRNDCWRALAFLRTDKPAGDVLHLIRSHRVGEAKISGDIARVEVTYDYVGSTSYRMRAGVQYVFVTGQPQEEKETFTVVNTRDGWRIADNYEFEFSRVSVATFLALFGNDGQRPGAVPLDPEEIPRLRALVTP